MGGYFQRQMADYVETHRDPWNCAMHVVGILLLFTGAVMPLTLVTVSIYGVELSLAVILALPVLVYWLLLDTGIGAGILAAAIVLVSVATALANQLSLVAMGAVFVVLIAAGVGAQVIGHKVFEQRRPSMVDHPAHFLLGPMFVMAKLYIALGFRRDLAAILAPLSASSLSARP